VALPTHQEVQVDSRRRDDGSSSSRTISQDEQNHDQYDPTARITYSNNFEGALFSKQAQNTDLSAIPDAMNESQATLRSVPVFAYDQNKQELYHFPQPAVPMLAARTPQSDARSQPDAVVKAPPLRPETERIQKPALRVYNEKSPLELRQLAKGALLSLAPHKIHYTDLVTEGINSQILRQLYNELGIKVEDIPQPDGNQAEEPQSNDPHRKSNPGQGSVVDAKQIAIPDPLQPGPPEISAQLPAPAVSPSLERKDRIAQLLAAKTGRPSPVRNLSESSPSASGTASQTKQELGDSARKSTGGEALIYRTQAEANNNQASQKEVLKDEGDDAARDPWLKRTTVFGSNIGTASAPIVPNPQTPLKISTRTQRHPEPSPLSSIPGLFMTSADPVQSGNTLSQDRGQDEISDTTKPARKRSLEVNADHMNAERSSKRQVRDALVDGMEVDRTPPDHEDSQLAAPTIGEQSVGNEIAIVTGVSSSQPSVFAVPSAAPASGGLNGASRSSTSTPFANQSKMRLTSAQIVEKAEMLKAKFLKQRANRQQALQEGLPQLDAEVEKTGSRLAKQKSELSDVKASIERIAAELAEARAREKTIQEDISGLERQLKEGVSGQKQYTDELRKLDTEQSATDSPTSTEKLASLITQPADRTLPEPVTGGAGLSTAESGEIPDTELPSIDTNHVDNNAHPTLPTAFNPHIEQRQPDEDSLMADAEVGLMDEVNQLPFEHAAPEEVEAQSATGSTYANVVQQDLHEPDGEYDEDEGEIREDSDGSASMSDSGPESEEEEEGEYDYDPEAMDEAPAPANDESEEGEYDPDEIAVAAPSAVDFALEDGDGNEGDVVPVDSASVSSQMSEEMVDSLDGDSIDATTTGNLQDRDRTVEESGTVIAPEKTHGAPTEATEINSEAQSKTNDSPRDTSENVSTLAGPTTIQPHLAALSSSNSTSSGFAPYQSPLSSFQSFRYHQKFKEAVPQGGYRSLTYSNNIDPSVPLCATELAGGVCENAKCGEQHFRHLGLSGITKSRIMLDSRLTIDR
jgi:Putative zinc-finger domain